ncbi:hypothetical protein L226DRAFT_203885 [Lentinus tigrinus ALCF2SS1-7]|uniref:Uncharacterized protein n=1 Tax=Lentinus tigrinus ALCF2SS1-6 TaxID=1328759 RepID=A0A5C2SRW9_9APHY|nr:hypothetical protein L227DRAFT_150283 [Lentinus tigrinus ALCF2SS1-6]RPD80563.1 hypothetical protein L226DRAFT_203885 [Lentinus tigrinus ALCF2SS1-7]
MLPPTRLLLRFALGQGPAGYHGSLSPGSTRPYPDDEAHAMSCHADTWAASLAHASEVLRWVGVLVHGSRLRSWTVSRVQFQVGGLPDNPGGSVMLQEEDEVRGWATVASKGMLMSLNG